MLAYCRGSQHVIEALRLNISNLAIEGFDQHLSFISLPNQGLAPSFRLSGLSGNQPPSPFNWQLWLVIIILLAGGGGGGPKEREIILTRPNWNIIRGPKVVANADFGRWLDLVKQECSSTSSSYLRTWQEKISNWLATSLTWLSAADLRLTIPNLLST